MSKSIAIYLTQSSNNQNVEADAARLQKLFEDKNLDYRMIDISKDQKKLDILTKAAQEHQCDNPPYVCINEVFIGGPKEISAFEATGELDRLINDR